MFQPCQHVIVCVECCVKVKRCLQCQMPVTAKISPGKIAKNSPGPEVIKLFFMFNSTEHEIYPAHKCLNANKSLAF